VGAADHPGADHCESHRCSFTSGPFVVMRTGGLRSVVRNTGRVEDPGERPGGGAEQLGSGEAA
jgi:hypothetical protein